MTIQEAITKAVEGGWKPYVCKKSPDGHDVDCVYSRTKLHAVLLNPDFWQALGKAMGWGEEIEILGAGKIRDGRTGALRHAVESEVVGISVKKWEAAQHRLISHLQDGGTIESFFNELP